MAKYCFISVPRAGSGLHQKVLCLSRVSTQVLSSALLALCAASKTAKAGLIGFGLGDAFQANAAASAKLKPDFHHLDA